LTARLTCSTWAMLRSWRCVHRKRKTYLVETGWVHDAGIATSSTQLPTLLCACCI
jgi:hypothetical protein